MCRSRVKSDERFPDSGTAADAINEFRREHAHLYLDLDKIRAEQAARSEQSLSARIDRGELVAAGDLAKAWKQTLQSLEQACDRGDLFRIYINGGWWYLADLLLLNAVEVARVCQELNGGDDITKLLFWEGRHGGLGGKTIAQALQAGQVQRAAEIARADALECGWVAPPNSRT